MGLQLWCRYLGFWMYSLEMITGQVAWREFGVNSGRFSLCLCLTALIIENDIFSSPNASVYGGLVVRYWWDYLHRWWKKRERQFEQKKFNQKFELEKLLNLENEKLYINRVEKTSLLKDVTVVKKVISEKMWLKDTTF